VFTGIVEEIGTIAAHTPGLIAVRAPVIARGVALGDSVATNGVCLTVTRFEGEIFWVDYSSSTRAATTIEAWRVGDKLNLERALTLNARLGGHLVAGHVDGVGRIISIREREGVHVAVALPDDLMRYLIPKGSITIDGVSLTVVGVHAGHFDLTIIPHSLKETTLQFRREGDRVNIEVDLIGKYVERLMGGAKAPGLTLEELARQGF
jgi:riboflavin synthase